MNQPLAYRMRPTHLDQIVGQQHLVGPNQIIKRMVDAKRLTSMILYGPPGIGKTSIASAIAGSTSYAFRTLNAATDTKKDLQIVAEEAKMSGSVILLLDEIHRLDKTKQDFLLPHLEQGRIVLIGATTENPYININPAIRSRCQIFELHSLTQDEIKASLMRALKEDKIMQQHHVEVLPEALDHFTRTTNGDLRSAMNALELAVLSTKPNPETGVIQITLEAAEQCVQKKAFSHDKDGDQHYDVISAFQKSIRGSDVDAALHYMARLIEAGELTILMRRLLVIAYEDIGLGNPAAAQRTVAAVQAAEKLGLPEARIPLANAVIELALSPKSNTAMTAIDVAWSDVRMGRGGKIPDPIKDAHYKGAEKLNRGVGYRFPHDYPDHWVSQQYLPDMLKHAHYFHPDKTRKYEEALAKQYEKYRHR
ncbi:Recombination protein MgsA [Granulicatella balaenopterae]|uniref:Recombination protein MgsA n=1 Tax=Granulicatella balaenopterae TaxID=137733 RepID=A0A1H9L6Q5_9LACT|nr:replication-associated recombination protein A [Granulicatella balaenopterae]SER06845.1 Recombination protein MgsA [Granulicatella balaenopterae]